MGAEERVLHQARPRARHDVLGGCAIGWLADYFAEAECFFASARATSSARRYRIDLSPQERAAACTTTTTTTTTPVWSPPRFIARWELRELVRRPRLLSRASVRGLTGVCVSFAALSVEGGLLLFCFVQCRCVAVVGRRAVAVPV